MLTQPSDLVLLAGRAIETGAFDRDGQAGGGDDFLAALAVIAPVHERIPVGEIVLVEPLLAAGGLVGWSGWLLPGEPMLLAGIQADGLDDVSIRAALLTLLEADGAHNALAAPENLRRRITRKNELILRLPLVFQTSRFAAIGQRRQRAGVQALSFQGGIARSLGLVAHNGDL